VIGRADVTMTATQVRELLTDRKIFPDLPADDTEFVFDSLGLVWFLHVLELTYDVVVDPTAPYLTGPTSVARISAGLAGGVGDGR
jgi:hypothetical protein